MLQRADLELLLYCALLALVASAFRGGAFLRSHGETSRFALALQHGFGQDVAKG
jgi:hypothetical protein